jgi:hypothetical protein
MFTGQLEAPHKIDSRWKFCVVWLELCWLNYSFRTTFKWYQFSPLPEKQIAALNGGRASGDRFGIFFHQEGTLPYFGSQMTAYLNKRHSNQRICSAGPVFWPPRSPALTYLLSIYGIFWKRRFIRAKYKRDWSSCIELRMLMVIYANALKSCNGQ